MKTPLLDRASTPAELKALPESSMQLLADEVRGEMIDAVSRTGGHLGAGLGVVELTVALHYIFDTPADKIIWDVGHQAYPHKILTGRRGEMRTLRQPGGLSGFTKRDESEYDPFGAAHSSTSISAGLGLAVGRDLKGEGHHVISVIGDGAMSAGMAYEAMNNAGAMSSKMLVILNDNDMSIAPAVGALSAYLGQLISSPRFHSLRGLAKQVARRFPVELGRTAKRAEEVARSVIGGGTIFSQLGFFYIGPVDGHDMGQLLPILRNIRDGMEGGPVLLHVVTEKGRGHPFNKGDGNKGDGNKGESDKGRGEKYHAVPSFDVITGTQKASASNVLSYTDAFAGALMRHAEVDESIVGVTAAMPSGTGLDKFAERFPHRCFDVGIAEQHGVTFAAGLAVAGFKPFCAIYSTFLQRGFDQVVHDVGLQRLAVRFAVDRAGLVGADGATHVGAYDLAYLGVVPGMVVMAPSDEAELCCAVATSVAIDDGPSAFRYPRGAGVGVPLPEEVVPWEVGRGRIMREGSGLAILSLGTRLGDVLLAADRLSAIGVEVSVADARFAKPIDTALIGRLCCEHESLLIVEEGSIGGFASHVLHYLHNGGYFDRGGCSVRVLTLPDRVIDHNSQAGQLAEAGLDAGAILAASAALLGVDLGKKGVVV